MSSPNITLTATLEDITGVAAGSTANPAKMVITLCNFGTSLPRVPGLLLTITNANLNGAVGGACAIAFTYSGANQTIPNGTPLKFAGLTTFPAFNGESLPCLGTSTNLVNVQVSNSYPTCASGSLVTETGTVELPGVMVAKVIVAETSTGSQISVALWGNDQITPAGTYYCIEVFDGDGNSVQCANYQFTGTQTIDLSDAVPLTSTPVNPGTVNANLVYAGPAAAPAAQPTFRSLVPADLPVATTGALGAVEPDGTTITVSGAGVISAVEPTSVTLAGDVTGPSGSNVVAVVPLAVLNTSTRQGGNTTLGTSGIPVGATGGSNTAFGYQCLFSLTTGGNNTAIGQALVSVTTGSRNLGVGSSAGAYITTGNDNICLGTSAGYVTNALAPIRTASLSIFIGTSTSAAADGDTNEIVIGGQAQGNGSNTTTLGNSSTTDSYIAGLVRAGGTAGGFKAALYTPASSSAAGVAGTIAWDANYIYICVATNTWKRVALTSF